MNHRISQLRQQSLEAHPRITSERALLLTQFCADEAHSCLPPPLLRARAFEHILAHKQIYIGEGELIVGERGPGPKLVPTYPEVCCHSLQDLHTLHSRPKTSYKVDEQTLGDYERIVIPYWRGKSQRERIFAKMTPEWLAAYEAGVFTEFMEQRAPGHTVLDDKIYHEGLLDFVERIQARQAQVSGADARARAERDQLEAMAIAARAVVAYARRHAAEACRLAQLEADPVRKAELSKIAQACERVPARAPRDFHEALQAYWFCHLGVIIEFNTWDAYNPGRLDQHLFPFYRKGLQDGTLTEDTARELLQAFWVKFHNQPAPPKVGVTAAESGTYTDFALINLGGVRPDGSDGVNELSILLLDVVEEMRLVQPSSMVQVSKKSPDRFVDRALRILRTGFGQPSIFNTDAIIQELLRQGKSIEDARCGGASGCVEAGAFGKENYTLTGYFNIPKMLELALHDGVDPRTRAQHGPRTGDPRGWQSFDQFYQAFERQMHHFLQVKREGNEVIERLYAEHLPAPFLSVLTDDCIENARDYHSGGARYNTNYIQGVGLGTATDGLSALHFLVFQERSVTMDALLQALSDNFQGHDWLHQLSLNRAPKYGNDDDRADDLMRRVFESYFSAIDGKPTWRGGTYRVNLLPTTCHVYFGSVIGALPDGRRAGEPLSEGVSPVQGADRSGPTAAALSVAKIDHVRTGGTLLNMRFAPSFLKDDEGIAKVRQLIRTYFRLDGHHIQLNVVTSEQLREAQREPHKHRDLIVRVAGYSDYFSDLSLELQEEIIRRTEHASL